MKNITKFVLIVYSLILSTSNLTIAQEKNIMGIIIDSLTKERIPYATVVIHNYNDSVIKYTYSNDTGEFAIQINENINGTINFSIIGYKKKHTIYHDLKMT